MVGGQVADMNVVADAGAVARVIIIAEDLHFAALSEQRFHHNRKQVLRILLQPANNSFFVIPDGVEIAQRNKTKPFQLPVPAHIIFNIKFCKTVKADRVDRMFLVNRQIFGIPIHGGR